MIINKNNKIYIHKEDGTVKQTSFIQGLYVTLKGQNSVMHIYEPCEFKLQFGVKRSHIKVCGNNNIIIINSNTKAKIKSLRIRAIGSNNHIEIGKNLTMTDGVDIDFANLNNMVFKIGDDCLFGQNIKIMLGDHHHIYSTHNKEELNIAKYGINIGNHVWLARNVTLLKDTIIGDNSVVAYGSLVTRKFEQSNTLIAGTPAKIVKENINWYY